MVLAGWECSELSGPATLPVRADLGQRTHPGSFGCLCGHHHGGGGAIGDRAAQAVRGGRLSVLCSKVCLFRHCRGRSGATSGHSWWGAVGIMMVSLTDTMATATGSASRRGDEVDPDQEMVGIGTSNIAAGFFLGVRCLRQRFRHSRGNAAEDSPMRPDEGMSPP